MKMKKNILVEKDKLLKKNLEIFKTFRIFFGNMADELHIFRVFKLHVSAKQKLTITMYT